MALWKYGSFLFSGKFKMTLISSMDLVPPKRYNWQKFEHYLPQKAYPFKFSI